MNLKTALQALADPKKKRDESLLQKVLPWAAAAGAGALTYKYLRSPTFSSNPSLARIQRAAQKGFHRTVEVASNPAAARGLEAAAGPNGEMSVGNRLKLLLTEGTTEAIPFVRKPSGGAKLVGRRGPIDVRGVVSNRTEAMSGSKQLVHGGIDIEGSKATQAAVTEMGVAGKGFEANLVQKYAPHVMPKTHTDVARMFHEIPSDRYKAVSELQKRMGTRYGKNMIVKPVGGLSSHGAFPEIGKGNWSEDLRHYDTHMGDSSLRRKYLAARRSGDNNEADYLLKNNLYRGHVLHGMMKDPMSVVAQQKIKNVIKEHRVHTIAGSAPAEMISSRWLSSESLSTSGNEDARKFVEDTLKKFPEKYQRGSYGVDVVSHRKADGSIGHKIIEMNPAERATGAVGGGHSGFLETSTNPLIGHMHYRAATGRHTPLLAAAAGLGTAGVTGLGARALTKKKDARSDDEESS